MVILFDVFLNHTDEAQSIQRPPISFSFKFLTLKSCVIRPKTFAFYLKSKKLDAQACKKKNCLQKKSGKSSKISLLLVENRYYSKICAGNCGKKLIFAVIFEISHLQLIKVALCKGKD